MTKTEQAQKRFIETLNRIEQMKKQEKQLPLHEVWFRLYELIDCIDEFKILLSTNGFKFKTVRISRNCPRIFAIEF